MPETTTTPHGAEAAPTPPVEGDVHDLSDREASNALVHGAIAGFFLVFVIAWAISMAVGLGPATSAAVAVWPAIVGGPFFGSLGFLVSALLGHEHAQATEVPGHATRG